MVRLIVDFSDCISVEKLELVLIRPHQIDMASPIAAPETALVRNAAGSDANTTQTTPATPAAKDTTTTPALTV